MEETNITNTEPNQSNTSDVNREPASAWVPAIVDFVALFFVNRSFFNEIVARISKNGFVSYGCWYFKNMFSLEVIQVISIDAN